MSTADALRGHDWLPDRLDPIPDLYATESTPLAEKLLHLHFFVGACDWYVAELDGDHRIAFGYVNLGDDQNAEWGYMDLTEMRGIVVRHPSGLPLIVERDLDWTPAKAGDVL
jgi:Protein of unknown function (DUF2958)